MLPLAGTRISRGNERQQLKGTDAMKTRILRSGFFFSAIALTIAAIWYERTAIRVWYAWRQLNRAEEKAFPAWLDRLAQFEEAAWPRLAAAFSHNDARGCGNARAVLVAIA